VALTTPDSQVPSPPSYPMTDDDGLDQPMPVERFGGGPVPAPRAGLLARVRDHFALRRALSRPANDAGDGVEIFSGTGAPSRGPRLSRAELARRRSEALRPSSGVDIDAPAGMTPHDAVGEVTGRSEPAPPRREPSLYQQLPPPARPSAYLGSETPARRPQPEPTDRRGSLAEEGLETADRVGLDWGLSGPDPAPPRQTTTWRPPEVEPVPAPSTSWHPSPAPPSPPSPSTTWRPRDAAELAAAGALPPSIPPVPAAAPPSPSQAREGRRLLALFGVAALVMFAVGLASAHSSSPVPTATTQPSTGQSSTGQPAGTQSQGAAPAPAPTTVPPAQGQPPSQGEPGPVGVPGLNDAKTLGDGGTGWQVAAIRWGDHKGFLRAVFQLGPNGAVTGKPKVTVGFSDPTTMLVALYGVTPAGGTGSLPNTKVVSAVSLLQPSPIAGATVYQVKLVHAQTVNPIFTGTSPLLLVIDIPS